MAPKDVPSAQTSETSAARADTAKSVDMRWERYIFAMIERADEMGIGWKWTNDRMTKERQKSTWFLSASRQALYKLHYQPFHPAIPNRHSPQSSRKPEYKSCVTYQNTTPFSVTLPQCSYQSAVATHIATRVGGTSSFIWIHLTWGRSMLFQALWSYFAFVTRVSHATTTRDQWEDAVAVSCNKWGPALE